MHKTTPQLRLAVAALGLAALLGCNDTGVTRAGHDPAIGPLETPVVVDPAQGTCYDRATTPAVIETVTEQIMVQPAIVRSDGSVETPAAFRTVTRQRILRERREVEFEVPCAQVQTPEFIASVQRSLLARGYYRGAITGVIDARTRAAIQRFQTDQGDIDTGLLTLRSARAMGLVALPRSDL